MDLESLKKIWNNENPYIEVQTSGSTSKPKRILVEKKRMIASAKLTCDKLKLKNCTALLCMNLKYIGAKMMVVRSEIANMRLITVPPSGHPLAMCTEPIDFAAMVPLQVYNSLQIPTEFKRLQQIKKLIIGGGPINETLLKSIANFPHEVYSTYGMTETLSHIALRRLNGPKANEWYEPFNNIEINLTADHCLIINAPMLCDSPITTNDIACIHPDGKRFRIIGRKDNVVISGGVKIHLEEIEQYLTSYLNTPFCCTSIRDNKFGEKLILLSESNDTKQIEQICKTFLPKYQQPKFITHINTIPRTETGKPQRGILKKWAEEKFL